MQIVTSNCYCCESMFCHVHVDFINRSRSSFSFSFKPPCSLFFISFALVEVRIVCGSAHGTFFMLFLIYFSKSTMSCNSCVAVPIAALTSCYFNLFLIYFSKSTMSCGISCIFLPWSPRHVWQCLWHLICMFFELLRFCVCSLMVFFIFAYCE